MRSSMTLAILALCIPAAAGCAAKKDTIAEPAAPVAATAPVPATANADDGIETGGLRIPEAIVRACNLHRAAPPPMFAFDSATLADQDRTLLADVAKCFSEGPLRDHGVALIGRADPRGEGEYNMALGESRADTVRRYLGDLGVSPKRVLATSRGEIDAVGKDEDGWAKDRRVDIELATR
jgi:peptidoglycan-associated lipoprotein